MTLKYSLAIAEADAWRKPRLRELTVQQFEHAMANAGVHEWALEEATSYDGLVAACERIGLIPPSPDSWFGWGRRCVALLAHGEASDA